MSTHYVSAWFVWLREMATHYEPAAAATLTAAFFQTAAALGIGVGDLPAKVDAVLAFLAVVSTLLAGGYVRGRVFSKATYDAEKVSAFARGKTLGKHVGAAERAFGRSGKV